MVSDSVMNLLMEFGVFSFVLPVAVLLAWRLRTRGKMFPAFAGVLFFLLFAKLLETFPYMVFVGMENPVSKLVCANQVTYALYNGIAAAIFEETARYLAFRYFLTKYRESCRVAITYGIGHGGAECVATLGLTNLQYYMAALVLQMENVEIDSQMAQIQEILTDITVADCVCWMISAILFLALQIALSVLVFQAYRNPSLCMRLLGIAMLFHMVSYLPDGFYQEGLVPHFAAVLLQLLIVGAAVFMAAVIYREMREAEKEREEQRKKRTVGKKNGSWEYATKKLSDIEDKDKD